MDTREKKYKPKKHGTPRIFWNQKYEDILLDLWEKNLVLLRTSQRKTRIYEDMADALQKRGLEVDRFDVKSKIDNLIKKYRTEATRIACLETPLQSWPNYNRIHKIMGTYVPTKSKADIFDITTNQSTYFADESSNDSRNDNDNRFELVNEIGDESDNIHETDICEIDPVEKKVCLEDITINHPATNTIERSTDKKIIASPTHDSINDDNDLFSNDDNSNDPIINSKLFRMAEARTEAVISMAKDYREYHKQMLRRDRINEKLLKLAERRTETIAAMAKDNKEFHQQMLELFRSQLRSRKERLCIDKSSSLL